MKDDAEERIRWKRRIVHTVVFYYAFFVLGWLNGQRGAAFLDLLLVTGSDVTLGSVLFTLAGIASILGVLAGGFLLDLTHRPVLLVAAAHLLCSVLNSVVTLCDVFLLMGLVTFLLHVAMGCIDVVLNSVVARMWRQGSRSYMQFLHFCFAFGAVLSPLATQPFLAPKQDVFETLEVEPLNRTFDNHGNILNNMVYALQNVTAQFGHVTRITPHTAEAVLVNASVSEPMSNSTEMSGFQETRVFYAFLISSMLCLSASLILPILLFFPVSEEEQDFSKDSEDIPVKAPRESSEHSEEIYRDQVIDDATEAFIGKSEENSCEDSVRQTAGNVKKTSTVGDGITHTADCIRGSFTVKLKEHGSEDRKRQPVRYVKTCTVGGEEPNFGDCLEQTDTNTSQDFTGEHTERSIRYYRMAKTASDRKETSTVGLTKHVTRHHNEQSDDDAKKSCTVDLREPSSEALLRQLAKAEQKSLTENDSDPDLNESNLEAVRRQIGEDDKQYPTEDGRKLATNNARDDLGRESLKETTENGARQKMGGLRLAAFVLMCAHTFTASYVSCADLLMTFVVRGLQWSKASGARLTSLYWVGLAAGRLGGVGVVRLLSPPRILTGCLLSLLLSFLALLLAAVFRLPWAVWLSSAAVGLFVAALFPTMMSYTDERVVRLTGRLASLVFATAMAPSVLDPLLLARLMAALGHRVFVYVFLAKTAMGLLCFRLAHHIVTSRLDTRRP